MKIKNSSFINQNSIPINQFRSKHKYQIIVNYWKKRKKECGKNLSKFCQPRIIYFIFSFLLASVMWVQVPPWDAERSKCAVDVHDSSCLWYVAAPDNTYGEGFNWENASWFDANGLQDVAKIEKESVVEKLQNNLITKVSISSINFYKYLNLIFSGLRFV